MTETDWLTQHSRVIKRNATPLARSDPESSKIDAIKHFSSAYYKAHGVLPILTLLQQAVDCSSGLACRGRRRAAQELGLNAEETN